MTKEKELSKLQQSLLNNISETNKAVEKKKTKLKTKRISVTIPDDPRLEHTIKEAIKLQVRFWKEKNM